MALEIRFLQCTNDGEARKVKINPMNRIDTDGIDANRMNLTINSTNPAVITRRSCMEWAIATSALVEDEDRSRDRDGRRSPPSMDSLELDEEGEPVDASAPSLTEACAGLILAMDEEAMDGFKNTRSRKGTNNQNPNVLHNDSAASRYPI